MGGFGLGISDGAAHAPTDDRHPAAALEFGRPAERAHYIENGVPGGERIQKQGGFPHLLIHDGDGPPFGIVIGDG